MFGVMVVMALDLEPILLPVVIAVMTFEESPCRNFYKGSVIDLVEISYFDPNASALGTVIPESFRHQ